MKYSMGYCLLLCLLLTRVQTKPQITKLFPIQEISTDDHQRENKNETRLFDKLLEKLRSSYNFVFHKTDNDAKNKTDVKEICAEKASNPNSEFNWKNPIISNLKLTEEVDNPKEKPVYQTRIKTLYDAPRNDRFDELQPLESLESLMPLESNEEENENNNKKDEVEFVTPATNPSNFSTTLRRQFVEWLSSLLGISYGIYAKFTRAIHNNNTLY